MRWILGLIAVGLWAQQPLPSPTNGAGGGGGGGTGTVTSVSVTTANGVSGSVATATTTPAITLTLGNITPTSVSTGGSPPALTPGTGGVMAGAEGTAPSVCAAISVDCWYWDSTQHGPMLSRNNGSYLPVPQGPVSSTSGHIASWNATNGGLLADGGAVAANLVVASAPGAGVAHFAGSTQTATSSSVVSADLNITTSTCSAPQVLTAISATAVGTCATVPIPQNSKSAAYTTVLGDAGEQILHPTADNNARTFTIDSNANVAYPVGTVLTFINQINTLTIAITTDTLQLAGTATTGSRTLAAGGMATAIKVTTTIWYISGPGLT